MPTYTTINAPVQQAVPGLPAYLLGSFDYSAADTVMTITKGSRSASNATITVQINAGNIPIVGQLISVLSDNSNFNVTGAPATISAVTIDATSGAGTVTYNTSGFGEILPVAMTGQAIAPVPEVGATLANATSAPLALQANTGPNNAQTIRFEVIISDTGTPTATVAVQSAMRNIDSEYTDAGAGTNLNFTAATGTKSYTAVDLRANFVRFKISGVSGGSSPKIVARVLV